jgi:hypothetical protein
MALQPPAQPLPMLVSSAGWPHARDAGTWLPLFAEAAVFLCWGVGVLLLAWLLLRRRDLIDPAIGAALVLTWSVPTATGDADRALVALGLASLVVGAVAGPALWRRRALLWRRPPDPSASGRLPGFLASVPEALFVARVAAVGTMCAALAHVASQPPNAATLWLRRVRAAAQGLPESSRARSCRRRSWWTTSCAAPAG